MKSWQPNSHTWMYHKPPASLTFTNLSKDAGTSSVTTRTTAVAHLGYRRDHRQTLASIESHRPRMQRRWSNPSVCADSNPKHTGKNHQPEEDAAAWVEVCCAKSVPRQSVKTAYICNQRGTSNTEKNALL